MVRKLALKSKLPAFIIWYKLIGEQIPMWVYVKKIAPEYKNGYSSPPKRISFNQWKDVELILHQGAISDTTCTNLNAIHTFNVDFTEWLFKEAIN